MDLFTPIFPPEKRHKHFLYITEPGFCEPEIEVIKSWADGFIDRNGQLVEEFQTKFNSAFWEIYLFACFKELGCSVIQQHAQTTSVSFSAKNLVLFQVTGESHRCYLVFHPLLQCIITCLVLPYRELRLNRG